MLTSQEYILKFRMNQKNYEFNRQEFIQQFASDFLVEYNRQLILKGNLPYKDFKDLVKKYNAKYWEISKLKKGSNLSKGLWGVFYARTVIPIRKKKYPQVQAKVERLKILNPKPKDKLKAQIGRTYTKLDLMALNNGYNPK